MCEPVSGQSQKIVGTIKFKKIFDLKSNNADSDGWHFVRDDRCKGRAGHRGNPQSPGEKTAKINTFLSPMIFFFDFWLIFMLM